MIYNNALYLAVVKEVERVVDEIGVCPDDFLFDVAEMAEQDWTTDGYLDIPSAIAEVEEHADQYIAFMKENYPKTQN